MHVDRVQQLDEAARAVGGSEPHRALFFEGQEGIGKTALLTELHRRHSDTTIFYVDLGDMFSESDVLGAVARQASRQGVRMDSFRALRQRYGEAPSVVFNHAEIKKANVDLALNVNSNRRMQNDALTDELVAALGESAHSSRIIMLLDSFEKCQAPLSDWIRRDLLPELLTSGRVGVFLAGRSVPSLQPQHSGLTRTLALPPFDPSIVEEWIALSGIEALKGLGHVIWGGTGGLPSMIKEFLSNYSTAEWPS
ncbi:hypothetical protein [Streptomyces sp. NBC_00467]|uniref:hypothetical protein n=1 Tax=Streptomyces sp. NBC_00467 TaxID=2975752 RepID=UPI002E171F63